MNKLDTFAKANTVAFNQIDSEFQIELLDTDVIDDEFNWILFSLERRKTDLGIITITLELDFTKPLISVALRDGFGDGTRHMSGESMYELECETLEAAVEWLKSLKYDEYEDDDGKTLAFAAAA